MIYIAGVSVLTPDKKIKKYLRRQLQVKDFIRDFIKHTSAFDIYVRTKKLLDVTHRSIPKNMPINSIFWPTGANRFAIGVFLVTEKTASYAFALSGIKSRNTVAYDRISTDTSGFTSHCLNQAEPTDTTTGEEIATGDSTPTEPDLSLVAVKMNDGVTAFNLMPVPIAVTQRSKNLMPFKYQSYFATWMIPIMYIPIMEADNIKKREEYISGKCDGFGILIMTDQRFLWNFIYVPQLSIASSELNDCYFNWYRILNILRLYLMPMQTDPEALAQYGRMFFVDTIDPLFDAEDDPCRTQEENPNQVSFDDDRAYLGPPIDMWSEGVDLTLSETFALIEQSLSKRLLFHPNWQVEIVNSVVGRKRMIRNLLLFVPRVVYKNDDLYSELEVAPPPADKRFVSEKCLESGGLIKNFPTTHLKVNSETGDVTVTNERVLDIPEPRYPITMPHVIEVVGGLYLTPNDDVRKPSPSSDGAMYYPFQYVYYQCSLVPKDQMIVANKELYDWPEDITQFSYDPAGNTTEYKMFQQIFIPGTLMGQNNRATYDISKIRILTSHLCVVRTSADNSEPETKEKSPSHLNRKPSWKLGRAIVRNTIGWFLFPFTWHFKHANYWPLTGYEDYLIICNNGSVYVKGYHAQFLSRRTGVKYVGWQSPVASSNIASVMGTHELLDNKKHHIDGSGEAATPHSVVASYPSGGIVKVPNIMVNDEPMQTKATVWSAVTAP